LLAALMEHWLAEHMESLLWHLDPGSYNLLLRTSKTLNHCALAHEEWFLSRTELVKRFRMRADNRLMWANALHSEVVALDPVPIAAREIATCLWNLNHPTFQKLYVITFPPGRQFLKADSYWPLWICCEMHRWRWCTWRCCTACAPNVPAQLSM